MAESDISISEMTNGTFSAGAIFPAIQPDGQSSTGYSNVKLSGSDIGDGIGQLQFPLRLDTTNKTIFGAINEAANAYVNILPTDTATGSIASFPDGANNIPCPSVLCTINPVQSGSGDPSPSNVRPITGHTELNLVHTGKNLLDKSQLILGKFYNFINGVIIEQNNANKAHSPLLKVKPSATYYMSGFAGNSYYSILALDSEKKPINYYGGASKTEPFIATLPNNCEFVYLNINAELVDTTMFCESDAIIPYEPYTGSTTTTDLGTTVYGGTLDVETGVLTIDKGYISFDGSENWVNVGGSYPFAFQIDTEITNKVDNPITSQGIVCNLFPQATTDVPSSNAIRWQVGGSTGSLYVYDYTHSGDLTGFTQMLSDNGLQVAYRLATPTTTQLTPQEVKSLLGSNNFYHDCNGQVAVTYKADIGLYIDKKTS